MKLRRVNIKTYETIKPKKIKVSITHHSGTVPLNFAMFYFEQ